MTAKQDRPAADSPTPTPAVTALRLVFDLGPWSSPDHPEWRESYDARVAEAVASGRQVYGVLAADLAPTPLAAALASVPRSQAGAEARGWADGWVDHAARVVGRYGDRIPVFEALPEPNLPLDGSAEPRVHASWFAYLLAALRAAWPKSRGKGKAPRLVAGALAGGLGGRAAAVDYVRRVYRVGRAANGWPAGMGVVDAWAMHADVTSDAGGDEVRVLAGALMRRGGAAPVLYVSGFRSSAADARSAPAQFPGAWFNRVVADPRVALAAGERLADGPVGPAEAHAYIAAAAGPSRSTRGAEADAAPGKVPAAALLAEEIGWFVMTPAAGAAVAPSREMGAGAARSSAPSRGAVVARSTGAARDAGAPGDVPVADGFDPPVGDRAAAAWNAYKCDTVLVDQAYRDNPKLRAWHPGEDWNGVRGGDTDKGDPIFAIGHGRVTTAQFFTPSWGNVVVIQHRLPDGTTVWSQYAHLDTMAVKAGDLVARSDKVGTMGKGANNAWLAHLHFEIRLTDLKPDNWRPMVDSRDQVLANYVAPRAWIDARRPGQLATPAGPPVVVDAAGTVPGAGAFARTPETNWFNSPAGLNGGAMFTFATNRAATNSGTWTANLPQPGKYLVSAFVPRRDATTQNAVYTVTHAGGETQVRIDQNRFSDAWVPLGQFTFADAGVVRLSDLTGEADGLKKRVCFDAVQWLPLAG